MLIDLAVGSLILKKIWNINDPQLILHHEILNRLKNKTRTQWTLTCLKPCFIIWMLSKVLVETNISCLSSSVTWTQTKINWEGKTPSLPWCFNLSCCCPMLCCSNEVSCLNELNPAHPNHQKHIFPLTSNEIHQSWQFWFCLSKIHLLRCLKAHQNSKGNGIYYVLLPWLGKNDI